jgi:hypothetical protein
VVEDDDDDPAPVELVVTGALLEAPFGCLMAGGILFAWARVGKSSFSILTATAAAPAELLFCGEAEAAGVVAGAPAGLVVADAAGVVAVAPAGQVVADAAAAPEPEEVAAEGAPAPDLDARTAFFFQPPPLAGVTLGSDVEVGWTPAFGPNFSAGM